MTLVGPMFLTTNVSEIVGRRFRNVSFKGTKGKTTRKNLILVIPTKVVT